jgi:SAM-dependent methyltransferase
MATSFEEIDFQSWLAGSEEAAAVAVPLVVDAVGPASVVDVGCGLGAWLAAFRAHGATDVVGYDGPWIDRSLLQIAPAEYRTWDLRNRLPAERRFDLAVCLEVAHLLDPPAGDALVESLAELSDVVLFSAGIPGQRGTNHENLQWPRYWADRFAARGLVATDPFRAELWEAPNVKWWFAQNTICFATEAALARLPALAEHRCPGGSPLPLVHPECFLDYVEAEAAAPRTSRWRRRAFT